MKFELTILVASAATIAAAPAPAVPIQGRDLPGLDSTQAKYATVIIERARAEGVGSLGCAAAIATALTESGLAMFANHAVPASMGMPHDNVGQDQDSVGLFQQRAVYYTDVGCTMDAACSAGLFFNDMRAISDWQGMEVGVLCQAIQRSQIPDAYYKWVGIARDICQASGF